MKKIIFSLLVTIAIIHSSCITSWQPLFNRNTAVADDRLAGTWDSDGQDYTVQKFFTSDYAKSMPGYKEQKSEPKSGNEKEDSILFSKSYIINYTKDKTQYYLIGVMVKLNGQFFMNFTSIGRNSTDKENLEEPPSRLATFTIARVKFTNSNMIRLDFIDGSYVYDQIKSGRMKLKHESDDLYDTFLITASTNELQQFIQKYGNDSRFFNKENSITLIRKS